MKYDTIGNKIYEPIANCDCGLTCSCDKCNSPMPKNTQENKIDLTKSLNQKPCDCDLVDCGCEKPSPNLGKESWEEEFDKQRLGCCFNIHCRFGSSDNHNIQIKTFIRQLLAQHKEQICGEIKEMKKDVKELFPTANVLIPTPELAQQVLQKECYNQAIKDILNRIKLNKKGEVEITADIIGETCRKEQPKPEWEEKFNTIVDKWREPEWEHQRHKKLIQYTADSFREIKKLIPKLLKKERQKQSEKMVEMLEEEFDKEFPPLGIIRMSLDKDIWRCKNSNPQEIKVGYDDNLRKKIKDFICKFLYEMQKS